MGFWFLSSAIAHQAGKFIANYTTIDQAKVFREKGVYDCLDNKNVKYDNVDLYKIDVNSRSIDDFKKYSFMFSKDDINAINECYSTQTMNICINVFNNLGYIAIGAAIFLFLLSPLLNRWMHGIK